MNKDCLSERYHSEPNLYYCRIIEGRLCESYRSEPNLQHCRVDSHRINTSVAKIHQSPVNEQPRFYRCRSDSYLLHLRINMAGVNELYRSEPKLHQYLRKIDNGMSNKSSSAHTTKDDCNKPQVLRPNNSYSALHRPQTVIHGGNYNLTKSEMIPRSRNTSSVECISQETVPIPELSKRDYCLSNERFPGYTKKPGCTIVQSPCSKNDRPSLQQPKYVILDGNNNLINSDMTRAQRNRPSLEYISQENASIYELSHDKMDHGLSGESSLDITTKTSCTNMQLPRSTNSYYREDYAQHLPGYVILDENDYLTERKMILAPRKKTSMESINQENNPIPELSDDKTGVKRLFKFRRSFIRYLSSCVNPKTEI